MMFSAIIRITAAVGDDPKAFYLDTGLRLCSGTSWLVGVVSNQRNRASEAVLQPPTECGRGPKLYIKGCIG